MEAGRRPLGGDVLRQGVLVQGAHGLAIPQADNGGGILDRSAREGDYVGGGGHQLASSTTVADHIACSD